MLKVSWQETAEYDVCYGRSGHRLGEMMRSKSMVSINRSAEFNHEVSLLGREYHFLLQSCYNKENLYRETLYNATKFNDFKSRCYLQKRKDEATEARRKLQVFRSDAIKTCQDLLKRHGAVPGDAPYEFDFDDFQMTIGVDLVYATTCPYGPP